MKEIIKKTRCVPTGDNCSQRETSPKGITLITLAITIMVMMIIAGVSLSTGTDLLQNARVTNFNTELKIIHTKVNEILEENPTQEELNSFGQDISGLDSTTQANIATAMGDASTDGFRYFNKSDLETIGVVDIDREVIINFTTKEVVDINGVKKDGNYIYRLEGWNNIHYIDKNTEAPEFSLTKKVYGLTATIQVTDIEYKGNVGKGQVSYCLFNNETEGNWKTVAGQEFTVEQSGIYKVRITDSAGNSTDKTIEIVIANKPKLDSGMTPVIYDSTLGKWKKVDENSGEWYDYASDKKQWANVMLQDGLVINADGTIDEANMGSMFVWIPRYMYQITEGYHPDETADLPIEGNVNIKFLKGTTNIATDGTNVKISNSSGENNWNVHPAFCDGTKNNYANGEWKEDITGFWVAKFEASSTEEANYANYGGGNTTELDVKVLPNVNSWRYINVTNIYNVCKKMTNTNNIYNLSATVNSHMMKNSEWGAVAYLTQSDYGNKQSKANSTSGVWSNPYHNGDSYHTTKTGAVGASRDTSTAVSSTTSSYSTYNEGNGTKGTTTGNVYGIYDLAGGAWEYVAGYLTAGTNLYVTFFKELPGNEKQEYLGNGDESDEGRKANFQANYEKYGDAIWETARDDAGSPWREEMINPYNVSWNGDYSYFPYVIGPFFLRGGGFKSASSDKGVFAFSGDADGGAGPYCGFRPAIVV